MKALIKVEKEVDIKKVRVDVAVRYGEEDIPNNFPMRYGDKWIANIDIDEGRILDCPEGVSGHLHMKVCDQGSYFLYDIDGNLVKSIEHDYVPNSLIPGKYGDYIDLNIDEKGMISNWYWKPTFEDFFEEEQECHHQWSNVKLIVSASGGLYAKCIRCNSNLT